VCLGQWFFSLKTLPLVEGEKDGCPMAKQAGQAVANPPAKEKPIHEIRIGKIKAVIWANQTDSGVRHNITLRRLFKRDDSSQWETSDSFGRDDLLLVAEVCRQAALWVYEHTKR
jgi:hypothetical protein